MTTIAEWIHHFETLDEEKLTTLLSAITALENNALFRDSYSELPLLKTMLENALAYLPHRYKR